MVVDAIVAAVAVAAVAVAAVAVAAVAVAAVAVAGQCLDHDMVGAVVLPVATLVLGENYSILAYGPSFGSNYTSMRLT